MAEVNDALVFRDRRLSKVAALVGGLGLAVTAAGFRIDPARAYVGYLTAFCFAAAIALGALVFLMTSYAVNAAWNVVIRRLNEAIVSVFPVLALLFVPVVLGLERLYLWVAPPEDLSEAARLLLVHKQPYLNVPFFVARSALYFGVWALVALVLRRWSLARDQAPPSAQLPEDHARERVFSCALLPLVALALTFAAFDWLMSLEPLWFSTLFGVYYFAGGFVACFGLLTVLSRIAERRGNAGRLIRPPHYHALGRLMLGFTVFWAYAAFFQAMLIQIANRPEEVEFYVHRTSHGWAVVAVLMVAVRFVLPFLLLLPRAPKFDGRAMAALGWLIVVGQYIDVYWLVAPSHPGHHAVPGVWDLSALLGVCGSCTAWAAWRQRGRAIVPVRDPLLEQSVAYRSPL